MGATVVSVGIDATLRQWSLRADELQRAVELVKNDPSETEEEINDRTMLTEEEERELAELMDE